MKDKIKRILKTLAADFNVPDTLFNRCYTPDKLDKIYAELKSDDSLVKIRAEFLRVVNELQPEGVVVEYKEVGE